VLAVVQHGRLTEIKSGSCVVSGLLAVQQLAITKRQRKFDLPARSDCTLVCRYSSPSTGPVEQVEVPDTKAPSTRGDWYSDPTRRYQFRWWDGSRWTQRVANPGAHDV
jgi:hypothetical protein